MINTNIWVERGVFTEAELTRLNKLLKSGKPESEWSESQKKFLNYTIIAMASWLDNNSH